MTFALSVAAIFKNESHGIREWVQHYLHHGVEHFYLIDDGSTDNYLPEIQDYIDQEKIHLFILDNWNVYLGRQKDIYNTFILPRLKESTWWLICDLDEYVWCPEHIDLKYHLNQLVGVIGQIQIENLYFGSNGYIQQPKKIVQSFTKREHKTPTGPGLRKYFVNSNFTFTSLNVHHATFANLEEEKHNFIYLSHDYYILNHYNLQSKEFWFNVKCKRGDVDNYRQRSEEEFYQGNFDEIEDFRLAQQNQGI